MLFSLAAVIATPLSRPVAQPAWRIKPIDVGYKRKKASAIRWRISRQRAEIEKTEDEVNGLLARLRSARLTATEAAAEQSRIDELRKEQREREATVMRLKAKIDASTRSGWFGAAARTMEVLAARQYASNEVFVATLRRQDDPWRLLRDDSNAILRLASNRSLVSGYAGLREARRLLPHAAAIYAKAAKLERYAPGILRALSATVPVSTSSSSAAATTAQLVSTSDAVDDATLGGAASSDDASAAAATAAPPPSYLELIEPHLDEILERFDDLEPHIPFVLEHMEQLAPHVNTHEGSQGSHTHAQWRRLAGLARARARARARIMPARPPARPQSVCVRALRAHSAILTACARARACAVQVGVLFRHIDALLLYATADGKDGRARTSRGAHTHKCPHRL